jgi:hypothetical protein
MHFNFAFSATQILWTLTFAAQLVLLVVLLGRDRINRYPLFSASIVLFALRLLTEVLLAGRLPQMTLRTVFISFAVLASLLSLAVVVEIARRGFVGAKRRTWVGWSLAAAVVAGGVLALWGPWPARAELAVDSPLALLRLMQFVAQKIDMLVDVLTIELGLLVLVAGRKFQAGWRSHTQAITIGLSTTAAAWLSVQGIWQVIARTVHPLTRADYERVINLGGKLVNANKVVYIAVLVWWILWLWFDEPKAAETSEEALTGEPAADGQAAFLTEWPQQDDAEQA